MSIETPKHTKTVPTKASKAFLALLSKQTGSVLPSYIYTQGRVR